MERALGFTVKARGENNMLRFSVVSCGLAVLVVMLTIGLAQLTVGTASAGNAPIKVGPGDLPPDVFPSINPCTGEEQIVTVTPGKGTIHEFETPSGHNHFVLSLQQGVISTSDGFSGRSTFHLAEHTNADNGTFTNVINQQISNGDGMRFIVHLVVQFTFANGVPVVEIENFSATCVGNHNGD